jgi:diaminopimelate decarboxylase
MQHAYSMSKKRLPFPVPMDAFNYVNNELFCENVRVSDIADTCGTPLFIYSRQTLLDHLERLQSAFGESDATICYSVKSCHNLHILRLLKENGASFDVVSIGELLRALEVGADPSQIVFAGVGKTDQEIRRAIDCEIGWFNVESEQELERIDAIAGELSCVANCALRVNPDVDPKTHRYTTTGKRETKFGVDLDRARKVFQTYSNRNNTRLAGIHVHIGSPVNTIEPYVRSTAKVIQLIDELRSAGFEIEALNIGGGFGAHYEAEEAPPAKDYADAILPMIRGKKLNLILEPGRSIAGNAGILVGRTIYTKKSGEREFLITDASMTELLRPALYEAYHFAWPVKPGDEFVPPHRGQDLKFPGTLLMDIVGPVCESGDFLAKDRWLPPMRRGDLIAIFTAGAYASVMGSRYNSRPFAAEVLVEGDSYRVIRKRESYEDMIAMEKVQSLP